MVNNTRTTFSFFMSNFVRLFITIALLILILYIAITLYQISRTKNDAEIRYSNLVASHKSLLLDQIALNRKGALKQNIILLRSELGVDKIAVQYGNGRKIFSPNQENHFPLSTRMLANNFEYFGLLSPYKIQLVSDFGNIRANITVFYSKSLINTIILPILISGLLFYIIATILICIIVLLFFSQINKIFVKPLQGLTQALNTNSPIRRKLLFDTITTYEIHKLMTAFETYIKEKLRNANALNSLAEQVAHDIRSTLYSLEMVAKDLSGLSENKRTLIREATKHIKETIHNLERDYSQEKQMNNEISNVLLLKIVNYVIEEKQEILNEGITLSHNFNASTYTVFVKVIVQELTRVLSNILNNAIEASRPGDNISFEIQLNQNFVRIIIADTGTGISSDEMHTIFDKHVSSKSTGKGLGLYHAKENIKNWNGRITVNSTINQGTDVIIDLPTQPIEAWFAPGFSIQGDVPIVIVDDAKEVHSIWRERISLICKHKQCPKIFSFYTPENFTTWYRNNPPPKAIYMIDYDYGKNDITGIDLIKSLKRSEVAFLVTSQSNDHSIHCACIASKVKLIPKFFIEHIPISLIDEKPELIILEPSSILIKTYKHRALINNKTLICYNNFERFMCDINLFEKTNLYLDEELLLQGDARLILLRLANHSIFITSFQTSSIPHLQGYNYVNKNFTFGGET